MTASADVAAATSIQLLQNASGKRSRFVMCEGNLGLLGEIIHKDPESYKEEFTEQFQFYVQTMKLLHLQPEQHRLDLQPLLESIIFLGGVAQFYPAEAKEFAAHLFSILRDQSSGLDSSVRMAFCKALVCLRNKNIVDPMEVLEIFFELMKVEDKHLRKFILSAIAAHLKRICNIKKDMKLLNKVQNYCIAKLKDSRSIIARAAQLVLVDAFRKKFCRDAKTANAIANCCFHKMPKLQVTAMKFFLGSKEDEEGIEEEDSEDEDEKQVETKSLKEVMVAYRSAKKTKKREKDLEKAKKKLNKKRKAKKEGRSKECNLQAIQYIYDPQGFADRLFGQLEQKKVDKFEVRLFRIALIARIIGVHRLQTLGFYSFLHRYLQPKQREVTRILLYAAQACHDLVPPDTIEQLIHCIAQSFITDRNSAEAITVGLNAIREILNNCPFAATEDLLRDLAEYKNYRNKNVSMAARGLIALCRTINPKLLHKRDRGRPVDDGEDEENEFIRFGVPAVRAFIPGAECLEEDREETGEVLNASESDEKNSSDSEDGEWKDIDDISGASESDDGEPSAKRRKRDRKMKKTKKSGEVYKRKSKQMKEGEAEEDSEEEDEDESGEECEEGDDEEMEWETDSEGEEGEEDEEDDGDDGEGWETVDDEEGEENEEKEEVGGSPSVEKKKKSVSFATDPGENPSEKATKISSERILTQEEFKKIKVWQIKKQIVGAKKLARGGKSKKQMNNDDRKIEEEVFEKFTQRETGDGLPRLNAIEHFHKKLRRATKEERMQTIMEGREGRDEFGKPKKNGPHVGKTNRENSKKKVFQMVRAKVRGDNRQRSFRDQQKSLRNYLLRQAGKKVNDKA